MNVMKKTASIIVLIVLLALSGQAQPTYIINHLFANASLLATSGCVEAQIFVDGADLVTRHGELVTPSDPAAGILIRGMILASNRTKEDTAKRTVCLLPETWNLLRSSETFVLWTNSATCATFLWP